MALSLAGADVMAGPHSRLRNSSLAGVRAGCPAPKSCSPSAMAQTTMKRHLTRSQSRRKPIAIQPKQECKELKPLFIQPPPRGLGFFLPVRGTPRSATPRTTQSPRLLMSPETSGVGSPSPKHAWVVFKAEEDWDETESSLEIGLGQVKAQIPLSFPPKKPITILKSPSFPKSPNSQLQLSVALTIQFPIELRKSDHEQVLLPVQLSLSFSLPLLPFITGMKGGAVAQSSFEFSVGEAQGSIPFCVPIPGQLSELASLAKAVPHLIHV